MMLEKIFHIVCSKILVQTTNMGIAISKFTVVLRSFGDPKEIVLGFRNYFFV